MRDIGLGLTLQAHLSFGDHYPLTSYSLENTVWMAWQFDRPEMGEGMVQVFRRPESPYESLRIKLHGLGPDAVYALTNFDVAGATRATGRELMDVGLSVTITNQPAAVVITYMITYMINCAGIFNSYYKRL